MTICNVTRRAPNWAPLSPEARATIEREPGAWDYVELWDGAAAQMTAFGVTRRAPPSNQRDMFEPDAEPDMTDPNQQELF